MKGRPKKRIPKGGYELITKLVSEGWPEYAIGWQLGMCKDTWIRLKDEDSRVIEALDKGRAREQVWLVKALKKAAQEGNPASAIFLLKARHGFKEADHNPISDRVNIIFNVPAALGQGQYSAAIEGRPVVPQIARNDDGSDS